MKFRVRSTTTKETIRIEIPSSSSLFDLKTLISLNLSATTPIPPESIHLSLNRNDKIASSPDESLQALGLTSGDLLFYSHESILNTTPETQNLSPASPGETFNRNDKIASSPDEPPHDLGLTSSDLLFYSHESILNSTPETQNLSPASPGETFNRNDEITSSFDEPLHALGLTSGDLLFYSHESILNSTRETQNLSPPSPGEILTSLSSAPSPPTDDMEVESESKPSPGETLTSLSSAPNPPTDDMEVDSESEPSPGETLTSLFSAPNPPTDDMEVDSESEPLVQQKASSVPCFLRRVMESEKEKIKGNMGLTVVAVHASFLESGFVACGVGGVSSLPEGCATTSHLVSVMYTLPDLISCDNLEDVKNVILKFSAVGNHVSVYGRLVGVRPDIYRLSLDSSKLAPLLASAVNEFNEKEQEDVFQLWKIVKDCLTMPLLIDICQNNGLALPPCFSRLPTDLMMLILELLPAIDLAKVACTCSELRHLASNDELWKRRFSEDFKMFVAGSTGSSWKDKFARFWVRRKKHSSKALAPYIGTTRTIPVQCIPLCPMIFVVDYDLVPAICNLGS